MKTRYRQRIVLRVPSEPAPVEVRLDETEPGVWRSRVAGFTHPVTRTFDASHPGVAAGKMLIWIRRRFGAWSFVRAESSALHPRTPRAGIARKGEAHGETHG